MYTTPIFWLHISCFQVKLVRVTTSYRNKPKICIFLCYSSLPHSAQSGVLRNAGNRREIGGRNAADPATVSTSEAGRGRQQEGAGVQGCTDRGRGRLSQVSVLTGLSDVRCLWCQIWDVRCLWCLGCQILDVRYKIYVITGLSEIFVVIRLYDISVVTRLSYVQCKISVGDICGDRAVW